MDYISHHALHSHIPIHHHTNHTAVTNHSFALIASPHLHLIHTLTYKQHTYTHPWRSLVLAPADISKRFPCILLPCVWPRTARPWNSEPVLVTSTPAWYCLRLCSASDIPVVVRWPLPGLFCLCLINLTASGSTRLSPVVTNRLCLLFILVLCMTTENIMWTALLSIQLYYRMLHFIE